MDKHLQQVFLSDADGWLATFTLQESIKQHAAGTIQHLKALHLKVELLSGDRTETVANTANEIGIQQYQAECSPSDKLHRLQSLKALNKKVLMVGD